MISNGDEIFAKNLRNSKWIYQHGINPIFFSAEFGSHLDNATKNRANNVFFKLRKLINKDLKLYNNNMKTCI